MSNLFKIFHKVKNLLFCLVVVFFITFNSRISIAVEWYENGTLHEASIRQWMSADYNNKRATCAGFIIATINDGYFLHDGDINSDTPLKRLSEILAENVDEYVEIANDKNEPISGVVLRAMLELGWIKQDYLIFLAKSASKIPSPKPKNELPDPSPNSNQKVRIKKHRLMSSAEGRKWVKKNIIPAMFFSENEFVERFGNYEKVTNSLTNKKTLEKYYFKHIDITFFVVQEDKTLIGFCNGKGYLK